MARVQLDHIWKRYTKDNAVVKDFNLDVQDKEFIVFVGPSGCGKTTTLRMIAGLEDISEGELKIGDRRVNDVAAKDRDIAMVFQNYALYPHMTVYDNMAFGLKLRKMATKEIALKVHAAAKVLDIEHLLDRRPKALSGGQRQRVALGRAIVREPQVFLLDEPLSNLDAKLRVQMRTEIRQLHQRLEATMIYVTHDQTEAMTMGDRIVVMKDGVIQQLDTPQEVYNRPSNMFVAGFIGSPAMNFIDGQVVAENGRVYFRSPTLSISLPEAKSQELRAQGVVGKPVVLGVRPEDVHADDIMLATYPDSTVQVHVEVVENMGPEIYLHVKSGEQTLVGRVNARLQFHPGSDIPLAFDPNKVHVFDVETERVIA